MFKLFVAASLAAMSQPAPTANWWWVAGDPGEDAITFVDADMVRRNGDQASFRAVRVTRNGSTHQIVWQARCDAPPSPAMAEMIAFACASDEARMERFVMLGALAPDEAAAAIFDAKPR